MVVISNIHVERWKQSESKSARQRRARD